METPQNVSFSTPVKSMQPNPMSKIRVIVRVRPFLSHEIKAKNGNPIPCVSVPDQDRESGGEVAVYLKDPLSSRNECYKLDAFFSQEDNNVNQIFYTEVCSLIPGIFYGCNATVFAYGATGSGKTYTMEGTVELPGLMPLAMSAVLSMCQRTRSTAEISYYEVYMDKCFDLLEPKEEEIAVWDDKDGRIHLRGLSRVPINSMSEFHDAFSCAIQRRRVGHTDLNDLSSRSHGVLVISVSNPFADESGTVVTGKLNLIDLAGNEDNRRTCNEGVRLQESAKINQSLFALSNVIYALNNNEPRIPYRESKLTRILQDSLGGTSRALMVACLNPGEYYESVHTVSLAARSRHISNYLPSTQKKETVKVKVDMEAKLRAWLDSKGKTKSSQRMGAFGSSSINRTPCSVSSVKKQDINSKPKLIALQSASSAKNREISGLHRNLFSNGCQVGSFMEHIPDHPGAEDNDGEKSKAITDASVLESKTPLPERVEAVQSSPLRKVLSTIDANVNIKRNPHGVFPFEPMTPQTPSVLSCESNKYQAISTPLSKFNAMSSNLKNSLAQEYVDFLNAASLEELVEVKGIGLRRAECIIGLRETSPLKSLSDLEKIGLSSKQVQNLFSTGAKGILFI